MLLIKPVLDIILPVISSFGMRYVSEEFNIIIKSLISNYLIKAVIFFCVFLSLVKNIYIALGLTILVFLLLMTIYNRDSKYSILIEHPITDMEIMNAKNVLEKAEMQKKQKKIQKL